MTLRKMKERLHISVQRDDLRNLYVDFINEARMELMKLHNFSAMKKVMPIVIPSGQDRIPLFADFKDFGDDPGVFLVDPQRLAGGAPPVKTFCKVEVRANMLRKISRRAWFLPYYPQYSTSTRWNGFGVWFDILDDTPLMGLPAPAEGDLNFEVSYYRYLPAVADDNDEDYLMREHGLMVLNYAKAVARDAIDDPLAPTNLAAAMALFRTAADKDTQSKIKGVRLRIGGGN